MKIAINGFERIERLAARVIIAREHLSLVAINDLSRIDHIAHVLKYDNTYGKVSRAIDLQNDHLQINEKKIQLSI